LLAEDPGIEPIIIDGIVDVAVEEYTNGQRSRVSNEVFREYIDEARVATLENCLNLTQIHEDQDPGYFAKHGMKVATG
jgi:hypothetical protein